MAENCIVPIHMERRNSDCEYVCDQPDGDFSTSTLQGHGGGEGGGEDSPCSYENITLRSHQWTHNSTWLPPEPVTLDLMESTGQFQEACQGASSPTAWHILAKMVDHSSVLSSISWAPPSTPLHISKTRSTSQ